MSASRTIAQAGSLVRQGRLSPVDLVDECLARNERHEGRIHAWVLIDADGARREAKQAADDLARGRDRGLLHGIPLGIKDIVDVAGWPTLAGSPIRRGHVAQHDAEIVARLRRAGAILLGKTVTTELASFDPPPTRNPWNVSRTPGGSSSGSAAATALGMCLGAIGSQTGGSITRPASFCGVCGCKPTYGRVSTRGVLPLAFSMDHPGVIARTVEDLAILLQVIAGPDEHDPFSASEPVGNYLDSIRKRTGSARSSPRPPRLGFIAPYFMDEADAEVHRATQKALDLLRNAGADVGLVAPAVDFARVNRLHRRVMAAEAAQLHRESFAARPAEHGPCIRALLEEGLGLSAVDYAEAKRYQPQFRNDMLASMAEFDALVTPATVTPAPGIESTGDPKFNSPWSYSGLPTVSIPCGLAGDGLPAGLQLVGRPFEEGPLLGVAAWCERQLGFPLAGLPL